MCIVSFLPPAPQVLGDVFESVVGAIMRDSDYNIEVVWGVVRQMMAPLLSSVRHEYLDEQQQQQQAGASEEEDSFRG